MKTSWQKPLRFLKLKVIANTSGDGRERASCPTSDLKRFGLTAKRCDDVLPLSQQVDAWRRQLLLDETLSAEQKLLARYASSPPAYSIGGTRAACLSPPAPLPGSSAPIFTSMERQKKKQASLAYHELTQLEDGPEMVAKQMELLVGLS